MTFTGKQLNDMGCPPNIIKFFVNKEFADENSVKEAFQNHKSLGKNEEEKEADRICKDDPDCAFRVLWDLGQEWSCLPGNPHQSDGKMTKSELRRILDSGSVRINQKFPKSVDFVDFPINDLVFFSGSKRQTTLR